MTYTRSGAAYGRGASAYARVGVEILDRFTGDAAEVVPRNIQLAQPGRHPDPRVKIVQPIRQPVML